MAELTDTQKCQCGHEPQWHHETRGCGYHGFSEDGRCKCQLTSNEAVTAIVREHVTAALDEIEAVVRHWEQFPALGRGTAASEIRRALHRAKEQNR
ncbi:hypothetical protein [Pimelobacter simplex]|uniref:hypothetical protein n=1 Tax=Nocardioides simplex TaxID=2045 RepID=UPI0021504D6B|nr:hypothetical protein [Pimelobacter simplex]UUW88372.1 hypothetical protein M0M43_21870 [Pimelobacter simplex]UUW97876.1 hypothetical protein M0M48_10515 [Pimelobacter simplex]